MHRDHFILNSIGVFPLPIGELESFDKSISGTKSEWLEKVLQKDLKGHADLKDAREFTTKLVDTIAPN